MRSYLLLTSLLLGACYNPSYVSGQVECGPGGACPEGFVCRTDNRCWQPGGGEVDLSGAPPADMSMPGRDGGDDMSAPPTPFLRVKDGRIVDGSGREVRLTGISWFGMEGPSFAPLGLGTRSLSAIMDTVKGLGYNFLRLPISNQLLDAGSRVSGIGAQNPDLMGLTGQQMLDRVIAEAGKRGLRVVLVRYAASAAGGQIPLWYAENYPEERWIGDWTRLAMRYRNNPTVVGFDLHAEPHAPAVWGGGDPKTDWRAAAERAGTAILAAHPELLVIVQGVDTAGNTGYWWGGNLKGAQTAPVRLPADRLVYGTNDYPRSVVDQPWFRDASYPNNLPALWDGIWGFLVKDPDPSKNTPVMITGFGGKLESMSDRQWIGKLGEYVQQNRLSLAYWCLNPDPFYGGILGADWATVQDARQSQIRPLLAPPIP